MKMLTSFWSERSSSEWISLDYPLHFNEHVFDDSDIIVREDEPASVIALALSSAITPSNFESSAVIPTVDSTDIEATLSRSQVSTLPPTSVVMMPASRLHMRRNGENRTHEPLD